MNYKKIVSCVLALSMITTIPAFAVDITDGTGTSEVQVDAEATQFSITVPSILPISVDAKGNRTVATDAKILNNSYGPVLVIEAEVQTKNGWMLVDETHNFAKDKVNTKNLRAMLQEATAAADGAVVIKRADWPSIPGGGGELPLAYDVEVSAQRQALTEEVAQVVFTVDWDISSTGGSPSTEESIKADKSNSSISNGALQIPAQIEGKPVTNIASGAFQGNQDIESVVLPETITKVEDNAFSGASNLTDVKLNEGLEEIGDNAFKDTSITEITIPSTTHTVGNNALDTPTLENVIINQTEEDFANNNIASNAIPETVKPNYNASNIPDENLPLDPTPVAEAASLNWDYTVDESTNTITLTNYKGASNDVIVKNTYEANGKTYNNVVLGGKGTPSNGPFYFEKDNITSIEFEDGVKLPANANFTFGFTKVSSLDLRGLDTSDVVDMTYFFHRCENLESVNLSGLDFSKVEKMVAMFNGCSSLVNVDFTNVDTSNVKNMNSMFSGCSSLKDFDVSVLDMSSVNSAAFMFSMCENMKSVVFNGKSNNALAKIESMFNKAHNLTTVDMSDFDLSNISSSDGAFYECSKLTNIIVKDEASKLVLKSSLYFPATCTITVKAA